MEKRFVIEEQMYTLLSVSSHFGSAWEPQYDKYDMKLGVIL